MDEYCILNNEYCSLIKISIVFTACDYTVDYIIEVILFRGYIEVTFVMNICGSHTNKKLSVYFALNEN